MSFTINDIDFAYVNLDCRRDRDAHCLREFWDKLQIVPRRVPGMLVTRNDTHLLNDETRQMFNRTPGAVGCWYSQTAIIKTAPVGKVVGVFEDDVVLCADFPDRLDEFSKQIPDDWDIAWLGSTFHCNPPVWHAKTLGRDAERVSGNVFRTYGCWSTYAWLIHPDSRERVLSLLDEHMHESNGIDDCCIKFLEPVLNTYCFVPGLCWQMDSQSNIGDGVTEFSLFKKSLGQHAWADRIGDFDPDSYEWKEAGYL